MIILIIDFPINYLVYENGQRSAQFPRAQGDNLKLLGSKTQGCLIYLDLTPKEKSNYADWRGGIYKCSILFTLNEHLKD